jgi:UDP-N-acetylmuramoyl-L-alanyl-D-glutamate--2,6-diaminopimelate ligase
VTLGGGTRSRRPSFGPGTEGLRVGQLVREIGEGATCAGSLEAVVTGVQQDSRRVAPGDLFVARRGASVDGSRFVADAIAKGAAAVLTEPGLVDAASVSVPVIEVPSVRASLGRAASAVYGHPSFSLELVGVTGTNGKTTTTHLVRDLLDDLEGRAACGLIGTVGNLLGPLSWPATHTTPEGDETARLLAAMRDAGAAYASMEVSSIALALDRVRGLRFHVAAFTNLTQDHLDFHGTMDAYGAAKASLFREHAPGSAVVAIDGEFGREIASSLTIPTLRVASFEGPRGREADLAPESVAFERDRMVGTLRTPSGRRDFIVPFAGRHNLQNALVALGCALQAGKDLDAALVALARVRGAPGRLERVSRSDDDITVLVDYAHTPDAVSRVLESVRASGPQQVICVIGCGGDRDATKRAPMGLAAAQGAALVVVTSDNPRTEDPAVIAASVEEGVRQVGKERHGSLRGVEDGYAVILDRREAIEEAVRSASAGAIVVVAGKGHEDYQIIGQEKRPFDDRVVARAALASRRERQAGRA